MGQDLPDSPVCGANPYIPAFCKARTRAIAMAALGFALATATVQTVSAADPQPYTVTIDATPDASLNRALHEVSTLIALATTAPVDAFGLVARAQADSARFVTALHSYGYYQGRVQVKIAGRTLDDPALDDWMAHAPAEPPVTVAVRVTPGALFRLGKVEYRGPAPKAILDRIKPAAGTPARAGDVQTARIRLLAALHDAGYALAQVDEPIAEINDDAQTIDIVYRVDAGPLAELGAIAIKGLHHVNTAFVRRRLPIKPGERFNPTAIEKARQDLSSLGVFASVRVRTAEQLDQNLRLPVEFELTERPRHTVNLAAHYSTDLGGNLSTTWQHRNVFGNAEPLQIGVGVTQLGGNSTTGIGYHGALSYAEPDFLRRDQALQTGISALRQRLIAYDQQSLTATLAIDRKHSAHWRSTVGLAGEASQIGQAGTTRDYTLLSLPMTLKFDSSNSLLDPTEGIRAAATLTPTQPLAGFQSNAFVMMQLSGSVYADLDGAGRSVLALRGAIVAIEGAGRFDLPPDKRAYAGGSATVRGYKFQSIGPRFADDQPQGGRSMSAAGMEFRQRIVGDWGAVAFVDGGEVAANTPLFTGGWHWGAGVGVRYYTAFGPIRVDAALPLNPQPGSGSFELYIGLGQAF